MEAIAQHLKSRGSTKGGTSQIARLDALIAGSGIPAPDCAFGASHLTEGSAMSKGDEYAPGAIGVVSRSARSIDEFILEARDGAIGMATASCRQGRHYGWTGTMPEPTMGSGRKLSINIAPGLTRVPEALPSPAVMEERNRLAREIHDTLVQEFAGILLHLEAAVSADDEKRCISPECLACARDLAKSGLEDARRMLLGLRPKSLEGATLGDALRQLAEGFSRDCGINCTFTASGRPNGLPAEIENELYRVAQEALCNARKHSRASSVAILLSFRSRGVLLAIKDNGQGFAMDQPKAGAHGFGLPTMCERASRLGGKMDINTRQGTGTEIRMSVPLAAKGSKVRNSQ